MSYTEIANGITVTTQCYTCIQIEHACDEHADLQEAKDAAIAYEMVDEGNLQYLRTWSWLKPESSAHDWIAPVTRLSKPAILADGSLLDERHEFAPQTTLLTDRIFDEPELEIRADELLCPECSLTYYGKMSICPNCN